MTDVKLPYRNTVNKWLLLFTIVIHYHCSRISEDERAEFLTKTERKKCKNTQNTILSAFYYTESVLDATEPKNRTES